MTLKLQHHSRSNQRPEEGRMKTIGNSASHCNTNSRSNQQPEEETGFANSDSHNIYLRIKERLHHQASSSPEQ
jgi:hypothetical protein